MKKYAATMPKENSTIYFVEANAQIAPTKFAKCFMKQEGVDHDTKRARASSCLVQTYNSSKKQQHSEVLLQALMLLWLYHTYDRGCMTSRTYHVNISYVSNTYGNIKRVWVLNEYQTVHYIPGQRGA